MNQSTQYILEAAKLQRQYLEEFKGDVVAERDALTKLINDEVLRVTGAKDICDATNNFEVYAKAMYDATMKVMGEEK